MTSPAKPSSAAIRVLVIIPTYNAEATLSAVLSQLNQQDWNDAVLLVVDSGSSDATIEIALRHDAQVVGIRDGEFNHGATREYARNLVSSDIVVYLTQDAIPARRDCISRLVDSLVADASVAVSYGRQLPRPGADVLEAFPREYNYGPNPHTRALVDAPRYGVYSFFCSNSCAAYRTAALDAVGGFTSILTNEDYFAVARMLERGYRIHYAANATVFHSHKYTLLEDFRRYFDTGYVRAERPFVQRLVGPAEARGIAYTSALLSKLIREAPGKIPYALIQSFSKWAGYRAGFCGRYLPLRLRAMLSQQRYYWRSRHYQPPEPCNQADPGAAD